MRRISIFDTPEDLGLAAAIDIADRIAAKQGRFVLGCPGGRSPQPVYKALGQIASRSQLDLSRLIILMMDDYVLPQAPGFAHVADDAHYSCRRFARYDIQAVLNAGLPAHRRIADANIWFPDPNKAPDYDRRIEAAGGIDFFLLASGAGDGHVAFNPPGSPFDSESRIVTLAEQTRTDNLQTFPDFAGLHDVPRHGVTVGIKTIVTQTRAAGMLVWGDDKKRAFRHLSSARHYDPSWPATVWAACQNSTLYADRAAFEGG